MATTVNTSVSLSGIGTDPIKNFRFLVEIHSPLVPEVIRLGFMSVSGLSVSTESIAYRQGNYNTTPQYSPGQSQFAPLTMQRGMLVGTNQGWEWMKSIFTVTAGDGPTGLDADYRASIDIKVLAHPVTHVKDLSKIPVKLWYRVVRAWPSSYATSDLDAGGNGFMVESMTVVHEGFDIGFSTKQAGSVARAPKLV